MDIDIFDGDELLALIHLDIEANRLEAALAKIKKALVLQDAPKEIYSIAGRVYAQLKLFERARPLFLKFIELTPDCVTEKFQLGMISFDSGDKQGAVALWKELLDEHPTHPPTLYYSALALAELNQVEQARRCVDILLKSAPVSNLYFERGKALLAAINKAGKPGGAEDSDGISSYTYNLEN